MEHSMWNPERLRTIGSIMERYSSHLKEGHRVRLGMEGDPFSVYGNASDAPVGTVIAIRKPEDKTQATLFTLRMDDGTLMELDNRNVDPGKIWEIPPDFTDQFRASVQEDEEQDPLATRQTDDDHYRGQMEARLSDLSDEIEALKQANRTAENRPDAEFRSATASTLRYIAADMLRLSKGEPLEFSTYYLDRYDNAIQTGDEDYRGKKAHRGSPQHLQTEKWAHLDTRENASEVESLKYGGDDMYADTTHITDEA